ncbi:uncharacterized protein LOC117174492 isoform X2 [Belonocnema kinseyi]|uniref:uncharacterized protein LOC117174492 isoform X2 n=1 Tax=Belonocnema kinseyi TaxID=2817044 RepID=UPI00143D0909|nr:uncharacterized protein LOC117174492 isoform X2 [Belonocnema kinseyi]
MSKSEETIVKKCWNCEWIIPEVQMKDLFSHSCFASYDEMKHAVYILDDGVVIIGPITFSVNNGLESSRHTYDRAAIWKVHLLTNCFDFCIYFAAVDWVILGPLGCKHKKTASKREEYAELILEKFSLHFPRRSESWPKKSV